MRSPSLYLASGAGKLATTALISLLALVPSIAAIQFTPAPPANLRLNDLGRVALAGDFDGLSVFEYLEQNENSYNTNGSQSLLARFPNGAFANIQTADAHIMAICPYVRDGEVKGIIVGGNFTSLGNIPAQGIALVSADDGTVTPLPGLYGKVAAVYCDTEKGRVYVGGRFEGLNSTNAVVWTTNWENMPFFGFDGPVTSIEKVNDKIVFGGSFTSLGTNSTGIRKNDTQVIPLASGDVTALYSIDRQGFNDPRSIICKTADTDGAGSTWLAPDNTPTYWEATFKFGFQPSKLRLYNTKFEGRGTRTWRFTALPDTGIMNLTYVNADGEQAYCDARCPLPEGNEEAQDFEFVNSVGMDGFRIDINEWYGAGAGLAGIELFQDDVYSYAINAFNEPQCDGVSPSASTSSFEGPWIETTAIDTNSDYLSIRVNETVPEPAGLSVSFTPNLEQGGNYSIKVYTPGCIQDSTCNLRGRVNVTATISADQTVSAEIFQTNNFDKYDEIFNGKIDSSSDGFPTVTLSPVSGQSPELGFLVFVAQRVRFELLEPSGGGLNGIYEFYPGEVNIDTDFEKSVYNRAGTSLNDNARINQIKVLGDETFVGGIFNNSDYSNIMKISGNDSVSLDQGGLNDGVMALHPSNDDLFVGGNFTGTRDGRTPGLGGVARYATKENRWSALGAGVDGIVQTIVPIQLNLTEGNSETALAISGVFNNINEFGENQAWEVQGFAIWIPSQQNWLQNTDLVTISLRGRLSAQSDVQGFGTFFAGAVNSQGLTASGAVGMLEEDGALRLQQYPFKIRSSAPTPLTRKRAATLNGQNITGAATGLIYEEDNLNYTIIAGHFTATVSADSNRGANVTNLLIINGTETVTGLNDELPEENTFVTVGIQNRRGALLFAGGSVTGNVNDQEVGGVIIYDLGAARLAEDQPEGFEGDEEVVVNAIAVQRNSDDVYVGGNFQRAGALPCPSLCVYNTEQAQWNAPQSGISGPVSVLQWMTDNQLMIGGDITVGGNKTTLATYDTQSRTYASFPGADTMPGPVTSFSAANQERSNFWVGGTATNGSAFIGKWDGAQWQFISHLLNPNSVVSALQVMPLSSDHDDSALIEPNRALFVMGALDVPNYGNASSALYDGTTFTPFVISSTAQNEGGSISHAFVQKENFFTSSNGKLAVGFVVLIALAIALGLIALIVLAGILAERWRRQRDGYMPANQNMMSGAGGGGNVSRIAPEALFGTIGKKGTPQL